MKNQSIATSFRPVRRLLAALVVAALGLAGAVPPAAPASEGVRSPPPSLLLLTLDTWRWDHIGASGAGRVRTPALDSLAREGFYEREILTPCPLTTPAHASLFTGLHPLRHRVLDCVSFSLPAGPPVLAEAFRGRGYRTGAVVSGDTLKRRFGLSRGFESYDDGGMDRNLADDLPACRDGEEVTRSGLEFIRKARAREPVFLWLHYFDMHVPYRPHPEFDSRYPGKRYAAQAAYVDSQVGKILEFLAGDAGRRWRIVVVGDHGEGLGDHHEVGHGLGLYRSTLSVPLLLHPSPPAPFPHARPWSLCDIYPTIMDWFGFPEPGKPDGESLMRPGSPGRTVAALSMQPAFQFGVNPCLGIRKDGWMYIRHGVEELYDISRDPGEMADLSKDLKYRDVLAGLRKACGAALPSRELQARAKPTLKSSPEELESLKSLGYIGGEIASVQDLQRADIRGLMDDFNALSRAREAGQRRKDARAVREAYEAFLKKYPKAAQISRLQGKILLTMGDFDGAFRALERAIKLIPEDYDTLLNLGTLYLKRGNPPVARVLLERALSLDASEPTVHLNLGILYSNHLGRPRDALAHFRRYLELAPQSAQAPEVRQSIAALQAASPDISP